MKKNKVQIEDYLFDESFQRYVMHPTSEDAQKWETWAAKNPEASDNIRNAKEIISFIAARRVIPNNQAISLQVYKRIQQQILDNSKQYKMPVRRISMKYYWYAASIIALIGLTVTLRYFSRTESNFVKKEFLEVLVPEGQRSQLKLPDGTLVWLNSGTQFKYPVDFLRNGRDVYISGEAFFNVKHRHNQPFIVHMQENLSIRVLGTEFNVKCYPSDKEIETTLVEGSIRLTKEDLNRHVLREIYLKPKQKAVYLKENQQLKVAQLASSIEKKSKNTKKSTIEESKSLNELEVVTAWKNEELVFRDETFSTIALQMERWYGMKITINDESLKNERFTGKFVNNETIYQVLDIFNRSESIQYSTNKKEIIIHKRKNNPKL